MTWVAVALGGALGAVARHGVNHLVHVTWPLLRFPLATLIVNGAGCLAIGVLTGLLMSGRISLRFTWREFLFVGVLGGFTTFSTFGLDTVTLARTGAPAQAVWNAAAQLGIGTLAVHLGILIGARA
jgi:CrcB protein